MSGECFWSVPGLLGDFLGSKGPPAPGDISLGIGWTPKFQSTFSEHLITVGPRAPEKNEPNLWTDDFVDIRACCFFFPVSCCRAENLK